MLDDGLTTAIAQAERRQVSIRALLLGTGLPFTAAIMAWSIWYGVRGFRRSVGRIS